MFADNCRVAFESESTGNALMNWEVKGRKGEEKWTGYFFGNLSPANRPSRPVLVVREASFVSRRNSETLHNVSLICDACARAAWGLGGWIGRSQQLVLFVALAISP